MILSSAFVLQTVSGVTAFDCVCCRTGSCAVMSQEMLFLCLCVLCIILRVHFSSSSSGRDICAFRLDAELLPIWRPPHWCSALIVTLLCFSIMYSFIIWTVGLGLDSCKACCFQHNRYKKNDWNKCTYCWVNTVIWKSRSRVWWCLRPPSYFTSTLSPFMSMCEPVGQWSCRKSSWLLSYVAQRPTK